MNQQNHPDSDSAWEEAMSRDFDARVRDLHEAPLDFTSVKGRARTIRRNRRAAVAGGILGVAAVITPIAVLTNGSDPQSREPDFAENSETATDPADGLDYVVGRTWHQADGDQVQLPSNDYSGAVIWDDQLVATRSSGEVFAEADVIAQDGTVIETLDTTSTVVVNDTGTTIAWVDTSGEVMTRWQDGEVSLGSIDLAAPGESTYFAAAIAGGPSCEEADGGCTVFVNSGVGEPQIFSSQGISDDPVPGAIEFNDASDDLLVTFTDTIENAGSCGGLVDANEAGGEPEWHTCDYQADKISPDGRHVIGLPAYYDGLGITEISVLDAATGGETGRYAPEGGFISQWAWSPDGQVVFDAYDGAQWHLFTMTTRGVISEIGQPMEGEDFDSPFTLIQH